MKKMRIVCKSVQVEYCSAHAGKVITRVVWQEVFSSTYKVDCEKWITMQRAKGDNTAYAIFVQEV